VSLGYTGAGSGWGVTNYFNALGRNVPGGNVAVQLSTVLPMANSGPHGEAEQLGAVAHQQVIAEEALKRQVASDVRVALNGLRANADALAAANEAVQYAEETVAAQQQRFKAGLATVFDVLLSESSLTSAQLNAIASRQAYANAIAQLRYASGTLLTNGTKTPLVSAAVLLTPP
jgi:outer membrane protein TolC